MDKAVYQQRDQAHSRKGVGAVPLENNIFDLTLPQHAHLQTEQPGHWSLCDEVGQTFDQHNYCCSNTCTKISNVMIQSKGWKIAFHS